MEYNQYNATQWIQKDRYILMDQKARKIEELKGLLIQAKGRLQLYRQEVEQKDKLIADLNTKLKRVEKYEEKAKTYENDNIQILEQYEVRLRKYQCSLEENEKLIESHQKQNQILSASQKNTSISIQKLNEIVSKLSFPTEKQSTDSIEELYSLEKIKEAQAEIENTVFMEKGISHLKKHLIKLLSDLNVFIEKRRELRLSFVKKQITLKKRIETLEAQVKESNQSIDKLQQDIKKKASQHKKQLDLQRHQYSKKIPKEQLNTQYVKNIFLKLYTGNIQSKKMSLKVMSNLLKLTDAQQKCVQKIIK